MHDLEAPNLLDQATLLIRELRNGREVTSNWPRFRTLVEKNISEICDTFSVRWLVSICDTYVDFGDPITARHAMTISCFVNMLRLAETVRFTRPEIDLGRWEAARGLPIPLYEEVSTFSIDNQDVFLNFSRRFALQLQADFLMSSIWRAVLRRLGSCDTAIAEFARLSPVRDRYFPMDPTGLRDNYGR